MSSLVRLNKFISNAGVTSRRKADELIELGKVKVNHQTSTALGTKIDPKHDVVVVNGKVISSKSELLTYAVNKPVDYVSTSKDDHQRNMIIDLVPKYPRVYPAGRLDRDSQGLIILTNDGDLAYRLTHPKYHIPKTYLVTVDRKLTRQELHRIRQGLQLKNFTSAPSEIEPIESNDAIMYQLVLHQGKNRQIRRMMAALNTRVLSLTRIAIGQFKLDELEASQYIKLNPDQIKKLLNRN